MAEWYFGDDGGGVWGCGSSSDESGLDEIWAFAKIWTSFYVWILYCKIR
jgi:hypothetical protein